VTQPIADAETVAVEWAKTLGLISGSAVATTVPDVSSWPSASGGSSVFLQVVGTGGGTVNDTPMRRSVVSFDSWATKANSDRPPLRIASYNLSDLIGQTSRYNRAVFPKRLTLATGLHVTVYSVMPINDHPRRIPDEDESRAHYSIDAEIMWAEES
jgi:hypothetical protein